MSSPAITLIELQREQALPKKFQRTFQTGDVIVLSGPDVTLEKVVADNKPAASCRYRASSRDPAQNNSMEMDGSQIRRGGGFVHYHVPQVAGHYSFAAQGRIGGFLKHSKLQWYAGYQDSRKLRLFTLDGKHASIREVRDGKSREVSRIPFNAESNQWVQVDMIVSAQFHYARVKTPDAEWNDVGTVSRTGRDFTQG